MAVAGIERTSPKLYNRERAEPVVLQFKYPIGMVERCSLATERHWNDREHV